MAVNLKRSYFRLHGKFTKLGRGERVHNRDRSVITGETIASENSRQKEYNRMRDSAAMQIIDQKSQSRGFVNGFYNCDRVIPSEVMQRKIVYR